MIAWSYSRLTDFEECAYRFKLKYIDKKPEEENPAATRGTAVHSDYEAYMKEPSKECPSSFFQPQLDHIKANYSWSSETNWAFDKDWNPRDWYDKETWLRIKPDLVFKQGNILNIIDYKTGKAHKIKHTAQGQLYAIGGNCLYPNITSINIAFWYHDLSSIFKFDLKTNQIEILKTNWAKRAKKLETSDFHPEPSKWNCKYCGVKQHCEFSHEPS
jgi:RecB family exonuclease